MKVALNIYPLKSAHKNRGIGFYTKNLLENLKKLDVEILEFDDISKVKDVDVVHYPYFDLFFRTLPINKKIPTIVTIHDVIPLLFPDQYPVGLKGRINLKLQKYSLRSCKKIITDSENSKKDIIKFLKVKEDKIEVIPLAADNIFKPFSDVDVIRSKKKYNLPDKFILYVGDVNYVKNLPFLIEGFNKLLEMNAYKDLKLVLVNGVFLKKVENIDHPELQSIKRVNELIKKYNLDNSIIRVGQIPTEELAALYNLATVYVQPSLYEGFGLPVLEALSCGTPVVCSRSASLPEVGGSAAVYFDPNNLEQFIKILSDVLNDNSLQNKLSNLSLEQAKKFSWENTAKETIRVYQSILK